MVKIPPNEFSHIGKNHTCKYFKHFCGFQCKQCNYYCEKLYGHKDLHKCFHGNIRHSSIFINDYTNKNSVANINKDNQSYKLTEGESVKIFVCDNYCKQQGQGHIHFFESEEEINSKDVKLEKIYTNKFLYKCKCSYFWENILKFDGDEM